MRRRLTTEEKLQKLAEETKRLQAELREKKRKDADDLYRLLGKTLVNYFKQKSRESGEGKEIADDLIVLAKANLNEREAQKAVKLIESRPFKMKP